MTVSFNPQHPARASGNASPVQEAAAQPAAQAPLNQDQVPTVSAGVHRRAASQAALLARLQHRTDAGPAQPSGTGAAQAHSDVGTEEGSSPAPAVDTETPSPQSHEEYAAHWNAWVRGGGIAGGNRTEAVRRMTAWLDSNDATAPLELSSLRLTRLPDLLPKALQVLDASDNRLSHLPDALPSTLQLLVVRNNQLTDLPDTLPNDLKVIDVGQNQLNHLPDSLPSALQTLVATNNRLTDLPGNITTRLSRACFVVLEGNPLPPRVIASLSAIINGSNYDGPRFKFPQSREEYLANWNAWVRVGGATGGNRTEAVRRMTAWLDGNDATAPLRLNSLGLTRLPDMLPSSLQVLDVGQNRLAYLPEKGNIALRAIVVADTQMTRLVSAALPSAIRPFYLYLCESDMPNWQNGLPDTLRVLRLAGNQLSSLPGTLPSGLRELDVRQNRLIGLPDSLPNALEVLDVSQNWLTRLPDSLPDALRVFNTRGNPLLESIST